MSTNIKSKSETTTTTTKILYEMMIEQWSKKKKIEKNSNCDCSFTFIDDKISYWISLFSFTFNLLQRIYTIHIVNEDLKCAVAVAAAWFLYFIIYCCHSYDSTIHQHYHILSFVHFVFSTCIFSCIVEQLYGIR